MLLTFTRQQGRYLRGSCYITCFAKRIDNLCVPKEYLDLPNVFSDLVAMFYPWYQPYVCTLSFLVFATCCTLTELERRVMNTWGPLPSSQAISAITSHTRVFLCEQEGWLSPSIYRLRHSQWHPIEEQLPDFPDLRRPWSATWGHSLIPLWSTS